ncbi:MAG: peptidoglycan bridge formation glycyltransferase FemA/FemB family protein [bacterium]|nr:peptidoglycan bridge formation glycyltransferase FemA/FemB family protein [bacterium]
MQVKELSEKEIWNSFIAAQKPHTFLHSFAWGEFNSQMGKKIFRLGVFQNDELMALALILKIDARRGTFLFCPHGPIIKDLNHTETILSHLTEKLKELAKEEKCDFIRFSPLLERNEHNQNIFEKLKYRELPMHMLHPELSWILDVSKDEKELLKGMRKSTRYCIKKAQKDGIEIEKSTDIKDLNKFWEIYKTTAKRHGFVPFSKEYLEKEFTIFNKDNQSLMIFANCKGKAVAGAIVIFGPNSGFYHHGASIREYDKLNTSHALQWAAIKECKKRKLNFYNFWGVKEKDVSRKHPWYGISLFKRGFGGLEQAYVHGKDLPLNWKYWLSWTIETLRKFKRGL